MQDDNASKQASNQASNLTSMPAGKPLAGIKVVDLTQIYQGPYASFLMATAGAEVIKVEPLTGERTRGAGGAATPLSFVMLNSNKKSITLNLKSERGISLLKDLVAQADVLLENFAVGTMDRLGIGWEVLRAINPQLIYVTGTGYGLTGPDHDLLAMDHTIQAASGIMSVTGDADRPPGRAGGAPCDIMGGIHMYAGAMTALQGRHQTGKGTRVEVSMLESMYFTLCSELTSFHATGDIPTRSSARSPAGACPYSRYECTDGWIAIICVAPTHWDSILHVIGRPDLVGSADFDTAPKRKARETEVNDMIQAWSITLAREEAYAAMRAANVPVAPIRDLREVQNDPHMHERGMLNYMTHDEMGDLVIPNSPLRFSEYEPNTVDFFPPVGAHNEDVFQGWLGLSPEEINALHNDEVI